MTQRLYTENNDYLDVSSDGKVFHKGLELKQRMIGEGYLCVQNQTKNYLVHRLVASAFIEPLKRGDRNRQVHHKNGIKTDNRVENLEILDMKDHQHEHKQKYQLTKTCAVCGQVFTPHKTKRKRAVVCSLECKKKLDKSNAAKRKKPVKQLSLNGDLIKIWESARDIQNETGFNETGVNQCCRNRLKHYKGYIWQYAQV